MTLENYIQHTAARIRVTIPVEWGGPRKIAYFGVERDLQTFDPEPDSLKFALNKLVDEIQDVANRRAPPTPQRQSACKYCQKPIKWPTPYKAGSGPLNLDGTPHNCRTGGG